MIYEHKFDNCRNLYEKLVREYEQLDIVISGDNMLNFIFTAYHIQEWMKRSPQSSSEVPKRFLKRVSTNKFIKLCKDVVHGDSQLDIFIVDNAAKEGAEFRPTRSPSQSDSLAVKKNTKKFSMKINEEEFDPFEFKEEVMELYSIYFKIK